MRSMRAAIWTALALFIGIQAIAEPIVSPQFAAAGYSTSDLGNVPGSFFIGSSLMFLDDNTLLMGDGSNLYSVDVTRTAGHVTGFDGTPTLFATTPGGTNGGMAVGPGGVIFYTNWNDEIGEIKPGSSATDKLIPFDPIFTATLGISSLTFVPSGIPTDSEMKVGLYGTNEFISLALTPDGSGTYNLSNVDPSTSLFWGASARGMAYYGAGNPLFTNPGLIVTEYGNQYIARYELDANGNPIFDQPDVVVCCSSNEMLGGTVDPLTGDYFFFDRNSGEASRLMYLTGFNAPTSSAVPEPGTIVLMSAGLGLIALTLRRRMQ